MMLKKLLTLLALGAATITHAQYKRITTFSGGHPHWLTVFNNKICFFGSDVTAGDELHQCDTSDNYSLVANMNNSQYPPYTSTFPQPMANLNGKLYFAQSDGTNPDELCVWDGVSSPQFIKQLNSSADTRNPVLWTPLANKIFFIRNWSSMSTAGKEICSYDPATHAVQVVHSSALNYYMMTDFQAKLYFSGAAQPGINGSLYVYDPASNNTTTIPGSSTTFREPVAMKVLNNKLYFIAWTIASSRYELYEYAGSGTPKNVTSTYTPTIHVADEYYSLGFFKGEVFFVGNDGGTMAYNKLFKYNPATSAITLVHTMDITGAPMHFFTELNNKLYFAGADNAHGAELWMYTGTGQPQMVHDLVAGFGSGGALELTVFNNDLYFVANELFSGLEVFRMDGGTNSIEHVKTISGLSAGPNPAHDVLTLTFTAHQPAKTSVIVNDITGKIVYTSQYTLPATGQQSIEIPVAGFAAGTYTYRLQNEQQQLLGTGKFVKE